jgi:hypothetical protein
LLIALEALPSNKNVGSLPFYEFCPRKTVGALLFVLFERGLTLMTIDEKTITMHDINININIEG